MLYHNPTCTQLNVLSELYFTDYTHIQKNKLSNMRYICDLCITCKKNYNKITIFYLKFMKDIPIVMTTGTRGQDPPFFREKKIPRFFFLFGIFVINLCYIIREISLFHIIREISLFHIIREISLFHIIREISLFLPVYYPAPATININILLILSWQGLDSKLEEIVRFL